MNSNGQESLNFFAVDDKVTPTRRIWEPASDDHPGGLLAAPGDRLIVRAVRESGQHPISVCHDDRLDQMVTFSVSADEIKPRTA